MAEKKFSIYAHILDHDNVTFKIEKNTPEELDNNQREYFKSQKYDRSEIENFIISFDGIQFKNDEDAKQKVLNFINYFTKEKFSRSYNKKYIDKNNNEKIYTYERLGTLDNSLISVHINTDNPHLHLVFNKKDKDKSFGKNYSVLQKAINKVANDLGLVTTLNREVNKEKDYELDKLQKDLKKFSWALKNNVNMEKRKFGQINIKNIIVKLNEFIDKKGSYTFAEKIKNDLIDKKYFSEIRLKKNPEHKYIFRKLEDNNYRKIAEKIYEDCKLSKPLNQEFRDFLRQDSKNSIEVFLKDSILDLYKNSNYEFSKISFEKSINLEKINEIYLVLQKEIEKYEKNKLEKLKTTKLINEKEIRKEIRGINLTYEEFEEKVGKSISHICFENNAKFMKENCKERDLEKLKEEISSLNETLSENYISNIAKKIIIEDEIQLRLGKTFKQESIEESKEEKKEEIREIYEESEKEKFEKIEINEVIKEKNEIKKEEQEIERIEEIQIKEKENELEKVEETYIKREEHEIEKDEDLEIEEDYYYDRDDDFDIDF